MTDYSSASLTDSALPRETTPAFWGFVSFALLIAAYFRLSLDFNAPYLDECDYIFVGRALLLGETWLTKTYMFSSDMHLYVYGVADALFPGERSYLAARGVALVLSGAALWFFYKFTRSLFAKRQNAVRIAEIATILVALSASHAFISKFATYDIFCVTLFTAALWLLTEGARKATDGSLRDSLLWIAGGAALYASATLAKYIALAYAPIFVLFLLFIRPRLGRALVLAAIFVLIVGAILGTYVYIHREALALLYQNQLLGSHAANVTRGAIALATAEYAGVIAALALLLVTVKERARLPRRIYAALTLCAMPLVAYHFYSSDIISFYKHIVFTWLFFSPIAGEALCATLERAAERDDDKVRALAGAAIVLVVGVFIWQMRAMHRAYPNTEGVIHVLQAEITPESTILSEDAYLFRYAFFPKIPTKNIEEMTWFDNNLDGKREAQDVKDAVWEGKFEYVYLNGLILRELGDELKNGIIQNRYEQIFAQPYHNSTVMNPVHTGVLSLYRRRK